MLDFGLAYCPGLTRDEAHSLPGTPSYIAPEAFAGTPPSAQQDLYAAGVTLYHLLTGHYPHGEVEAFQHPRFGQPVPASRYRPDLPAWLDEVLSRAVAAAPAQRFETAEEWLLVVEQGERQALNVRPRPLLEREPLKVWRGVALASLLLNLILAWNEAFWTLNLSTLEAAPLTVFIASYSSPEGLFWAKLSAASTLAIAPILVLGWFSQRQLVRGLTFGAVK